MQNVIVSRSSICLSVCPSVCNVELMYAEHISWTSSKLVTLIISLRSSLLGATTSAIWSKGNTPKIWLEYGWGSSLRKPALSLKRGKIGSRLLLTTNRNSHTRFRLVPKSTTLDDAEGPLRTVLQKTCVFRSPHHENLNEDRPSDDDVVQWLDIVTI